jgi:HD superfamily phosphohydrolase
VKDDAERGTDTLYPQQLPEKWWNDRALDEIIQSVRLAALLHDVGHAPFTHVFEDICKANHIEFDHEKMSRKIVEERPKELGLLSPFDSSSINEILDPNGEAGRSCPLNWSVTPAAGHIF